MIAHFISPRGENANVSVGDAVGAGQASHRATDARPRRVRGASHLNLFSGFHYDGELPAATCGWTNVVQATGLKVKRAIICEDHRPRTLHTLRVLHPCVYEACMTPLTHTTQVSQEDTADGLMFLSEHPLCMRSNTLHQLPPGQSYHSIPERYPPKCIRK